MTSTGRVGGVVDRHRHPPGRPWEVTARQASSRGQPDLGAVADRPRSGHQRSTHAASSRPPEPPSTAPPHRPRSRCTSRGPAAVSSTTSSATTSRYSLATDQAAETASGTERLPLDPGSGSPGGRASDVDAGRATSGRGRPIGQRRPEQRAVAGADVDQGEAPSGLPSAAARPASASVWMARREQRRDACAEVRKCRAGAPARAVEAVLAVERPLHRDPPRLGVAGGSWRRRYGRSLVGSGTPSRGLERPQ